MQLWTKTWTAGTRSKQTKIVVVFRLKDCLYKCILRPERTVLIYNFDFQSWNIADPEDANKRDVILHAVL